MDSLLAGFHTRGVTPTCPGVYARISNDPHELEAGVSRQVEDARIKARSLGWPDNLALYVENDTSAFRKRKVTLPDGSVGYRVIRPVFRQAVADLQNGVIDGLLVYDLDRLARETRDLDDLVDVVMATRRPVHGVTSDIDLMTADGQMMARVIVSMAQKSSQDTGRRVSRAAAAKARSGKQYKGGRRPFGWAEDRVHLHPIEAPVLEQVIVTVAEGGGLNKAFRDLLDSGVPTVSGTPWRYATMRHMVRSARVAGIRSYGGKGRLTKPTRADWQGLAVRHDDGSYVMGDWDAVVPIGLWEQANRVLDSNKTNETWRRKHLLSGILRCGRCGARMYARPHSKRGQSRYVCPGKSHGGCGGVARDQRALEELIIKLVARRLALLGEHPTPSVTVVDEAEPIRRRIAELQDQYANGNIGGQVFFTTLGKLEERLTVATRSMEAQRRGVDGPRVMKMRDAWLDQQTTTAQRRAILSRLITAIEVMPANRGARSPLDAERELRVCWRE